MTGVTYYRVPYTNESRAVDEVEDYEFQHRDIEDEYYYKNNKYYIGLVAYQNENILLASSVTVKTFMNFYNDKLLHFLNHYSINSKTTFDKLEIMKVYIENQDTINESICALVKTSWIRIIQRNWKRVFKERQDFINNNLCEYLRKRELGVNHSKIPTIHGMLSHLKKI